MTVQEKLTFNVVFSQTNVPVILATIKKLIDAEQPRILNNEFNTIVHNARTDGKLELLKDFENYIINQ